jgi:mRNA interferase MazF
MRFGMMHKQGDILLIPIPFSDLKATKRRPVLVLSNNKYNNITDDIVVAAITSNIDNKYTEIKITNKDMKDGVLKKDSVIRVDKLYTLSQKIVVKRFGSVKSNVLNSVILKVQEIIL